MWRAPRTRSCQASGMLELETANLRWWIPRIGGRPERVEDGRWDEADMFTIVLKSRSSRCSCSHSRRTGEAALKFVPHGKWGGSVLMMFLRVSPWLRSSSSVTAMCISAHQSGETLRPNIFPLVRRKADLVWTSATIAEPDIRRDACKCRYVACRNQTFSQRQDKKEAMRWWTKSCTFGL